MRPAYITIGQIVNTHGIRGDLKLNPWRVEPAQLLGIRHFFVDGQALQPQSMRVHKNTLLFRLPGVEDMDAALAYKGKEVQIAPQEAQLPPGTYFDQELLGLEVLEAESGASLGHISDVLSYPAHKIYEVSGEKRYLIPAVPGVFIQQLDVEGGRVTIHLLEGLELDGN